MTLDIAMIFLTPKVKKAKREKTDKLDFIKTKCLCIKGYYIKTVKKTIHEMGEYLKIMYQIRD